MSRISLNFTRLKVSRKDLDLRICEKVKLCEEKYIDLVNGCPTIKVDKNVLTGINNKS